MKEGGKEAFKLLFLKDELRMGQSEQREKADSRQGTGITKTQRTVVDTENGEFSMSRGKEYAARVSEKRTRKGSWRPIVKGLVYSAKKFGL